MKKLVAMIAVLAAGTGMAWSQGSFGGAGGAMMGSSGVLIVADDGSLLLTEMNMTGMMGGGSGPTVVREVINIDAGGSERWRASFDDGWPMMPANDGDLVVVVLLDDWFMGSGGWGDGGWGGPHMGGGKDAGHGAGDGMSTVVGLDLATGGERWRATLAGDMAMAPRFAPDGSRIYLSVVEFGSAAGPGQGPMRQGDAAGAGSMMSSTVIALDRAGNELWTYDSGDE